MGTSHEALPKTRGKTIMIIATRIYNKSWYNRLSQKSFAYPPPYLLVLVWLVGWGSCLAGWLRVLLIICGGGGGCLFACLALLCFEEMVINPSKPTRNTQLKENFKSSQANEVLCIYGCKLKSKPFTND